ncbi:MAG TPA: hypothetical protein VFP34_02510 [Microlunatus sp.]|nr:hypothetical protein [Microlunatus sp.]
MTEGMASAPPAPIGMMQTASHDLAVPVVLLDADPIAADDLGQKPQLNKPNGATEVGM